MVITKQQQIGGEGDAPFLNAQEYATDISLHLPTGELGYDLQSQNTTTRERNILYAILLNALTHIQDIFGTNVGLQDGFPTQT